MKAFIKIFLFVVFAALLQACTEDTDVPTPDDTNIPTVGLNDDVKNDEGPGWGGTLDPLGDGE